MKRILCKAQYLSGSEFATFRSPEVKEEVSEDDIALLITENTSDVPAIREVSVAMLTVPGSAQEDEAVRGIIINIDPTVLVDGLGTHILSAIAKAAMFCNQ